MHKSNNVDLRRFETVTSYIYKHFIDMVRMFARRFAKPLLPHWWYSKYDLHVGKQFAFTRANYNYSLYLEKSCICEQYTNRVYNPRVCKYLENHNFHIYEHLAVSCESFVNYRLNILRKYKDRD